MLFTDAIDPIDPTDSMDPTEPIKATDPTDRIESPLPPDKMLVVEKALNADATERALNEETALHTEAKDPIARRHDRDAMLTGCEKAG